MEGGGEGLVAVVSWLTDEGLAFNVLSSRQWRLPEKLTTPRPSRNSSNAVASQTVSEHNYRRRRLSPEPFASTYQVSHCGVDTRSFDRLHGEFPPQRPKPSSEFGNFEVGNNNRWHSFARSDHSYRGNLNKLGSRGWQFSPQQERYVASFVNSLRKYPSVTPHGPHPPTTQLLKQLLKTSRNHSPKQSHNQTFLKKRRQFWDKARLLASLSLYANKVKESNKRPRKKKHTAADNYAKQKEYSMRRLVSVTTFDYLNSGGQTSVGSRTKTTENTTYKNVFREKYRDQGRPVTAFPVCPILQSRYEKHLKKYHASTSKIPHVASEDFPTCSKCLKRRPCPCEMHKHVRRIVDKDVQEIKQFEDAIFSWLKDIPVYPNESPQDTFIRDTIVKKLARSLNKVDKADFAVQGKEDIKQALDKMPMWYPQGESERENFKNDAIDNLLEKVKNVYDMKMFNQATRDFFDDIQIGKEIDAEQALDNFIAELNKIALNRPVNNNLYRDLLKLKAFELLNGLYIRSSGNKYEYFNKLADELADHLLNVSVKTKDVTQKSNMAEAIRNMLNETNVRINDRDSVERKLHAILNDIVAHNIDKDKATMDIKSILEGKVPHSEIENITNKTLLLAEISHGTHDVQIDPDTTEIILDDIRDILDDFDAPIKDRDKIEEHLHKLVCDMATKGVNEDKAESRIKSLLKGKVSEDQQKHITNRVLELATDAKETHFKPLNQEIKRNLNEDIRQILENSDATIKDKNKIRDHFNQLVSDVVTKGVSKEKASSEIKSVLEGKVPIHQLDDITQQLLKLADGTKEIYKETKIIENEIRDLLNDSKVPIKNRMKVQEDLSRLVSDITKKGLDDSTVKSQLESIMKGNVPDHKHKEITEQVLTLADRVNAIDDDAKKEIKRDVQDILSDSQIKNKRQVEENLGKLVADITKKGMHKNKAETKVKALLEGKVSEDKVEDITEQALKLVDRVKPLDQGTKNIINEDIRDILENSNANIKNKDKLTDNLNKLMSNVVKKDISAEKASSEIESILKGKVPTDKQEQITHQLLELADQTKEIFKETKLIEEEVRDLLNNANVPIKNKMKVEKDLGRLVSDITKKGLDDSTAKNQLESIIKGNVPDHKHKEITEQVLTLADRVNAIDDDAKQEIKRDVQDILSGSQIRNKRQVEENLGKLVADITKKGMHKNKAETEIKALLDGKASEDKLEDIIEQALKLVDRVKPLDQGTKNIINEDIRDILENTNANIKNKDKITDNLNKLVSNVVKKDISKDKASSEIKSILKGKVPTDIQEQITHQLLELADQTKEIFKETKIIEDEMRDLLNNAKVPIKKKMKVEQDLGRLVSDITKKGLDDSTAKSQLESIIKGNVPDHKHKEITEQVLTLADRVNAIDDDAKQEIKRDVQDILSDSQIKNKRQVEENLGKLVADITKKGMHKNKAETEIEALLKDKVSKHKLEDITEQALELVDRVKPLDQGTKSIINQDIRDILENSNANIKNKDKVTDNLNKLVSNVVRKDISAEKASSEIKSILKGHVPTDIQEQITHQLLELADQTKEIFKETKIIEDEMRDLLNNAKVPIKNKMKVEQDLGRLVSDITKKGLDDSTAKSQLESIIKGNVPDHKHKEITEQVLTLADRVNAIDDDAKQEIKRDVQDILSGSRIKNKGQVEENLGKLVADITKKGMHKNKAETKVKALLEGKVSEHKLEDITEQALELVDRVKPLDQGTKNIINEDIRDILENSNANIKNKDKVTDNLNKLVSNVVKKDISNDKASSEIKSILKGKVPIDVQEQITRQLLELANQTKEIFKETKIIEEEVRDLLNNANVPIKNKMKVEQDLGQLVSDITKKGLDDSTAKSQLESIIKGNIPDHKHKEITEKVLTLADRVNAIDDDAKQEIKRDVQDILSGSQIKNKGQVEENLGKLVSDITKKGMHKNKAETKVKALLEGKVSKDKLEDITEQALELVDRVKPLDQGTKNIINEDIRDILENSNANIKNKEKVTDNLNKLVSNVVKKDMSTEKAGSEIKSILKGKVPTDIQEQITQQLLELANQTKEIFKETKLIEKEVRDLLNDSDIPIKNRMKVEENLGRLVSDITKKGLEDDQAKTQIKSIIKGNVPDHKHEEITEQILTLAGRLNAIDDDSKEEIKRDVHDILSDSQIKNKGKVEEDLSKLVAGISTNRMDQDKAETKIKALLEGNVPEEKLEVIIKQALKLVDRVKPLDKETKQIIKENIHDILDNSNVPTKKRGKADENLSKIVADVLKGMDKAEAETKTHSLFIDSVSEKEREDIIKKVLSLAKQIKHKAKPIDPKTKQNIDKQISDILYQSQPDIKGNRKIEKKLGSIVSDIMMKRISRDKAKQSIKNLLKGKTSEDNVKGIVLQVLELAKHMEEIPNMSQETLYEDISDILDRTNIHIKNRNKVEERIRDIVSDQVMRGLDKSKAHDYIHSTLKGNVPDSQIEDIYMKIFALAENLSRNSEDIDGPIASSTQNEDKILFDQVFEVIRDWLKKRDIHLSDKKLNEVAEGIANETLDRRKYLQLNPGAKISEAKESEILKEQIYKVLNKLIEKKMVQLIMTEADDLMASLKQIPTLQVSRDSSKRLVQNSMQFVQENLEGALLNWLKKSPIYLDRDQKNKKTQEQIMVELAEALTAVLGSQEIQKPGTNSDEMLLKEITKNLERFPLGPEFKSMDTRTLASQILDYLKKIQLFQDISARDSQGTKFSFMSTTNQLNDIVKDWCDALPLSNTDEAFRIKQDLAFRIILKVGELNVNQDIFNDDMLYDEILQDFIDQQLKNLPMEANVTDANKKRLIDQIKQIKQKIQDDFIGRKYKQRLRDTVSNVLPSIACATAEDLASFELMKENLADAFINLNYSVEDDTTRLKFKRRIIDEVNKYVNDYLKRCPATPFNTRKLNEDLYNALKNVPIPDDESMRTEVESVRMKDVINDWLKTLPMSKQSPSEQLHTNKVVTLMAQKLQELEKGYHPNFEEIAVAEISSYLKKLPLKNKNNLQEMAKKLVDKIKQTAESRSFVERTSKINDDCLCDDIPLAYFPRQTGPSCASFIPPCGLSKEDQKKMQRIRERAILCESGTQSRRCKDAAVDPPPLDHGSQTDMPCNNKCCQHAGNPEPVCSKSAQKTTKPIPAASRPCTSTQDNWHSNLGNKVEYATQTPIEESGRICIPSSFLNTDHICRPRASLTSRRVPVKRSRAETSTYQRPTATPRRQFTSACPNEFFSRPKHCSRCPPVPDRDYVRSGYRCFGQNRGRMKSPCLSCKRDPTKICDKCIRMHMCPHPTCLYFK